jgi:hypothetical protein
MLALVPQASSWIAELKDDLTAGTLLRRMLKRSTSHVKTSSTM